MLTVYTDGGERKKHSKHLSTNPAAWAYIIYDEKGECIKFDSGAELGETHAYMEARAVLEALKELPGGTSECILITDSQNYIFKALNEEDGWLKRWRINSWKSSSGKEIKNKEIWEKINDIIQEKSLKLHVKWTAAHCGESGDDRNVECDNLVNEAMDNLLSRLSTKS